MEIIRYIIRYVVAGAVGYGFSVVAGYFIIKPIVEGLHENYGPSREEKCEILPQITGALDRFLYTSAWLTPYKEFIGIWLLVKVARGWRVPERPAEKPSSEKTDKKRDEVSKYEVGRYNIFMIGNALCVIFGVRARWNIYTKDATILA